MLMLALTSWTNGSFSVVSFNVFTIGVFMIQDLMSVQAFVPPFPTKLVAIAPLKEGSLTIMNGIQGGVSASSPFLLGSTQAGSAFGFCVMARDVQQLSLFSGKYSVPVSSGLTPFFFRYEVSEASFPVDVSVNDVDIYPFSGAADCMVLDSTPRIAGNSVFLGVGMFFNEPLNKVYLSMSISQYLDPVRFFQPMK